MDLIENSTSGFNVEVSSTSKFDYVLIEDQLGAANMGNKKSSTVQEVPPLSLTAMNLFPISSSTSSAPTFTLGKPFQKRLRVVERLGNGVGGDVGKKAKAAKKDFVE